MAHDQDNSAAHAQVTPEAIGAVLTGLLRRDQEELLAMTQEQLDKRWFWAWDDRGGIEWNIYKFSDALERHKERCRRWEEHHNGNVCVVERVRDRYLMPRLREFRAILAERMAALDALNKPVGPA